jgi:carboxylesterase
MGVVDPENLPFMLCPPGAETAVLLVHGFTATPWEMRPLAEFLADAGIASLAVRLPGHGTSPEDLAGRRWEEWFRAVLDGYQILSKGFQSIYGMGMSTGCLLLLTLAKDNPIGGLVLFSPYLRVLHRLAPYAGWLRWIRPYHVKSADEGLNERYYNRRPVAGIHQINRLTQTVRGQLAHIVCPVLAFNGAGDQTVDINSGRQLVALLGSPVKIHAQYGPDVPHVLTSEENPCRWSMFVQAARFVQELDNPSPDVR